MKPPMSVLIVGALSAPLATAGALWLLTGKPKPPPPDTPEMRCIEAADAEYDRLSLGIAERSFPQSLVERMLKDPTFHGPIPESTVQDVLDQRRLEEQHCARIAKCQIGDRTSANSFFVLFFSACLSDIERERVKDDEDIKASDR
jgi:hypothetical protein